MSKVNKMSASLINFLMRTDVRFSAVSWTTVVRLLLVRFRARLSYKEVVKCWPTTSKFIKIYMADEKLNKIRISLSFYWRLNIAYKFSYRHIAFLASLCRTNLNLCQLIQDMDLSNTLFPLRVTFSIKLHLIHSTFFYFLELFWPTPFLFSKFSSFFKNSWELIDLC